MTPRYWYVTAEARRAVEAQMQKRGARAWNPFDDSPSLATLGGNAGLYKSKYRASRERLFEAAGVEYWFRSHYFRAARCYRSVGFVRLPKVAPAVRRRARSA